MKNPTGTYNPYTKSQNTRWTELQEFTKMVMEIGLVFDKSGIDVHFLNRRSQKGVRSFKDVERLFQSPPNGLTPIVSAINRLYGKYANPIRGGRKILLIIVTDGLPTDERHSVTFKSVLVNRARYAAYDRLPVTIAACTDEKCDVDILKEMNSDDEFLDVVDHYKSEAKEIQRVQGPEFPFSFEDYIVKSVLGAVDSRTGKLDKNRLPPHEWQFAAFGELNQQGVPQQVSGSFQPPYLGQPLDYALGYPQQGYQPSSSSQGYQPQQDYQGYYPSMSTEGHRPQDNQPVQGYQSFRHSGYQAN